MGLVAGLSVLHQFHEMVDAVPQEFRLGVFWHTVDAVIVNDVGIDEWVAPGSERGLGNNPNVSTHAFDRLPKRQ